MHPRKLGALIAFGTISAIIAGPLAAQEPLTMSEPPAVSQDHVALLASADPRLAANKRLVYDMYRIVLQGGHHDRAHEFIAEGYIQHNPNAAQGLAGIVDYVRTARRFAGPRGAARQPRPAPRRQQEAGLRHVPHRAARRPSRARA